MEAQHGRDVGVREDVAVEHDHPPAHEVRRVPHPARRTEGRLLDGVGELDAEAAPVAHRAAHLVDHVGAGEHGAVDTVAEKLCRLFDMGIRHVATMHNFGALDPALVERSMSLFAREVVPQLRSTTTGA